ncbi:MAG: hypothetical protein ABS87_04560 [Sphingomonas sp. SCN 67-18]|uniref:DUF3572 domain-containing protein n=1 Tax=uncultured Sphingomonas sp. TaxID=158754 RepID=UPI00086E8E3B|nr:DUF3572 domain-containing protein [Sphingomonas sp. SCN 67-18]ODU21980.1 MAG: hypothetical protein ABS87_04560 [Sphingomonas sp. SCN 67-18]
MRKPETNPQDAIAIGLAALGWAVSDPARADRLLALTGLTPDDLRRRAADPVLLVALLGFLEAHEPDLLACAAALEIAPAMLVDVRRMLEP